MVESAGGIVDEQSPGPGWTKGLDGKWYEDEEPAPGAAPVTNAPPSRWASPSPSAGPGGEPSSPWAPPSLPADPGGETPPTRFYAMATIIGPPILVVGFGIVGLSALSDPSGRLIGIACTAIAVFAALSALRTPYVAIVGPDGSLTFRTLTGSKETGISRVSRVGRRVRGRASTWVFEFDGTSASLSDVGGRALAHYVIERNPSVDYPRGRCKM
jgi:hypothetical protein